jgi:hypothetical protein
LQPALPNFSAILTCRRRFSSGDRVLDRRGCGEFNGKLNGQLSENYRRIIGELAHLCSKAFRVAPYADFLIVFFTSNGFVTAGVDEALHLRESGELIFKSENKSENLSEN